MKRSLLLKALSCLICVLSAQSSVQAMSDKERKENIQRLRQQIQVCKINIKKLEDAIYACDCKIQKYGDCPGWRTVSHFMDASNERLFYCNQKDKLQEELEEAEEWLKQIQQK